MTKLYIVIIGIVLLFSFSFGASYTGELISKDRKITVDFKDADLIDIIRMMGRNFQLNIAVGENIKGKVTISLINVPIDDALEQMLKMNGYTYIKEGEVIRVITIDDAKKEFGDDGKTKKTTETAIKKLYKVYAIKNKTAESVNEKIREVVKPDDKIIVDEVSNKLVMFIDKDEETILDDMIKEIDTGDGYRPKIQAQGGLRTVIIPVRYSTAANMVDIIGSLYPNVAANIRASDVMGGIVATSLEEKDIVKIESIINAFDLQPLQVSVEAKIVEISGEDNRKLGIDWKYGMTKDDTGGIGTVNGGVSNGTIVGQMADGASLNFSLISGATLDFTMKALLNSSNVNLLSNPNITTLSGKTAVITVGDKIPYPVATSDGKVTIITYSFENVGIRLEVTPTILENGIISMQIKPQVSNENGRTPDNRPIVATRDAETNVIVKDGETLVIGGLMRNDEVKISNQVPILGDIPLIGEFFKSTSVTMKKTNLIFFITPKVLGGRNFKNKIEFNMTQDIVPEKTTVQEKQKEIKEMTLREKEVYVRNRKELIKLYETAGAFKKAIEEIEELQRNNLSDGETDALYNKLKQGGGDKK